MHAGDFQMLCFFFALAAQFGKWPGRVHAGFCPGTVLLSVFGDFGNVSCQKGRVLAEGFLGVAGVLVQPPRRWGLPTIALCLVLMKVALCPLHWPVFDCIDSMRLFYLTQRFWYTERPSYLFTKNRKIRRDGSPDRWLALLFWWPFQLWGLGVISLEAVT